MRRLGVAGWAWLTAVVHALLLVPRWWWWRRRRPAATTTPGGVRTVPLSVLRPGLALVALAPSAPLALVPAAARGGGWRVVAPRGAVGACVLPACRIPPGVAPSDFGLPYAVIVRDEDGVRRYYGSDQPLTALLEETR